jgi:hypothetical protein
MKAETLIMRRIREAIMRTGRARVVRNNVGFDELLKIPYGLGRGSPDLVGLLRGSGRVFCLEVKAPGGRASREQTLWADVMRRDGAFVAFVNSPEQAIEALTRAENGASL